MSWLLDTRNASIRYLTMTQLLHRRLNDPEVQSARAQIPKSRWAKLVFSGMQDASFWESPITCYNPKYSVTVWRLQLLAQLGMPAEDRRIKNACERFLEQHVHRDGGFSCGSRKHRTRYSEECITGRMVATLCSFGYQNDPRVRDAIEWLANHQLDDGGWNCRHSPTTSHSSIYSTQMALWGYSALDPNLRGEYRNVIKRGTEFMLRHRLFKSHHTGKIIRKDWLELKFPGNVGYDILHALLVLLRLGVRRDERLSDAHDVLCQKRRKDGRWNLDVVPRHWGSGGPSDCYLQLEREGRPSRWITLNALTVLSQLGLQSCNYR